MKYWAGQPVSSKESQARLSELLAEPPSTSLDLYHKERNKKELGEAISLLETLEDFLTDENIAHTELKTVLKLLKRLTE